MKLGIEPQQDMQDGHRRIANAGIRLNRFSPPTWLAWLALVPLLICLAYIFGLRQGKPPGYDRDCFEYLLTGRGFSPQTGHYCTHPLL